MGQFRESNIAVFGDAAVAAGGAYLRVKLTTQNTDGSWNVTTCGANDVGIGVMDNQAIFTAGREVNVWLNNDNKTRIYQANAAITAGAFVYGAAGGLIGPSGLLTVGIALQAASGAGSYIEVLPLSGSLSGVQNQPLTFVPGNVTYSSNTPATLIFNSSAASTLTLIAPTTPGQDGTELKIINNSTWANVVLATGLFVNGTSGSNTATFANKAGYAIDLIAIGGKWVVANNYSFGATFA